MPTAQIVLASCCIVFASCSTSSPKPEPIEARQPAETESNEPKSLRNLDLDIDVSLKPEGRLHPLDEYIGKTVPLLRPARIMRDVDGNDTLERKYHLTKYLHSPAGIKDEEIATLPKGHLVALERKVVKKEESALGNISGNVFVQGHTTLANGDTYKFEYGYSIISNVGGHSSAPAPWEPEEDSSETK